MGKPIPDYLRLHSAEDPPSTAISAGSAKTLLGEFCGAFEDATGWPLRFEAGEPTSQDAGLLWSAPVNPGVGTAPGHLRLALGPERPQSGPAIAPLEAAARLAGTGGELVTALARHQAALREREAELAAGVPIVPHGDEDAHFASRLEALLSGAARLTGCVAAGLYLLDADTTWLKLRSRWGLPGERLTEPPRPLSEALADLEALLGHAVVLSDTSIFRQWNPPEQYPAAVCVPVSTPTVPLGTLWVFAPTIRDFDDHQTETLEIVAGRIATELERQMLLAEALTGRRLQRQVQRAAELLAAQLPTHAPHAPAWQMAGWSTQAQAIGGAYYDWFARHDGRLGLVLAEAQPRGLEAALVASGLRGAVRAHAEATADPARVLAAANRSQWSHGPTHEAAPTAALFYGLVDPASGTLRYATAGDVCAVRLRPRGCESLVEPQLPLGVDVTGQFPSRRTRLAPGDVLLVATRTVRDGCDAAGRPLALSRLARALLPHLDCTASDLAELAREVVAHHAGVRAEPADQALLVVRRVTEGCADA